MIMNPMLNPYFGGLNVSGKNFVGREHILEAVQKRERGILIIGPFRWGKTPILREGIRLLGSENVTCAAAGYSTGKEVLRSLFYSINPRMKAPENYQEAIEKLKKLDKKLQTQEKFKFIFIDEFTHIPYFKDLKDAAETLAFFHALKELKAIKLVIAIHPHGVWKAQELFPSFLDVLDHHNVGPLLEQDVDKLIELSAVVEVTFSQDAREEIHRRTGRIAIFVQSLLEKTVREAKADTIQPDALPELDFDFRRQWMWCFTQHQRDIIRIVLGNAGINVNDMAKATMLLEDRVDPERLLADLDILTQTGFGVLVKQENALRINGEILQNAIGALVGPEQRYGFDYLKR